MSDPKPDGPPDTADPDGAPAENPSGADNSGGIEANRSNPEVPLVTVDAD